jgi:hypothetical protein
MEKEENVIYTHDEATLLVGLFDNVLAEYGIHVPSPEDDEREEDSMAGLYGSTYSDLLDSVEDSLVEILNRHKPDTKVVQDVYSGTL